MPITTRRVTAAVLAGLLVGQPVAPASAPVLGHIRGIVTVSGRPVPGLDIALVDVATGTVLRARSAAGGAFDLAVAPGEYVLVAESRAGLVVSRAPAVIPVEAGRVASADVDLLALPSAVLPQEDAPESALTIDHTPVGCLIAGEYALLEADIQAAAAVAHARVYFKSSLASGFYFVEMARQEAKFVGKLPRPKIEASPIVYYVGATAAGTDEVRTPQYTATVVASEAECPQGPVAPIGPAGAVQVYSAATGAAITPAGFAASGLALTAGIVSLVLSGAAAAGIGATINVFNPQPTPNPTPTPSPTPTPTPTPPPPPPSPEPSPSPRPTPCIPPPGCTTC